MTTLIQPRNEELSFATTEQTVRKKFIESLPKAELHVHLDGTLEPAMMWKIAERNQLPLNKKDGSLYQSVNEISMAYKFANLQEFLALYFLGAGVMRTEQDFYELTYAYLAKAHQDNVRHAEMFVGPQTHTWKAGMNIDIIMDGTVRAIKAAKEEFGITANIIIDFDRSHVDDITIIGTLGWSEQAKFDAPRDAEKTFEAVQDYLQRNTDNQQYIVGFGLDYAEVGFPPIWFKDLFKVIRESGYKTVAHAGEEGPAEYIWQAINDLGVSRIDHGNRATEDAKLLEVIINKEIPLTMCPLSNVALRNRQLGDEADLSEHPAKYMLSKGVLVTINSDDPAYFGGYINANFEAIATALNLDIPQLYEISKNSINASFLSPELKLEYLEQIDLYYENFILTSIMIDSQNMCPNPLITVNGEVIMECYIS